MKRLLLIAYMLISLCKLQAQVPTITSFSPDRGPVGTTVTITGSNFSPVPSDNFVFFGAVRALVNIATTTSLAVTVPAGATFEPITVTRSTLTGYSDKPFILTFNGQGYGFSNCGEQFDFPAGSEIASLELGDFDNDNRVDIALIDSDNRNLSIYRNTGLNGSLSFSKFAQYPTPNYENDIFPADLNGDGKLDLVTVNPLTNRLYVYQNQNVPGIAFTKLEFILPGYGSDVAVGDLDGDGKPEIVVSHPGLQTITILTTTVISGAINISVAYSTTVGVSPDGISITDLDGDGKREIIFSNQGNDNNLSILKNNSDPGLFLFDNRIVYPGVKGGGDTKTGDLDGDGKPDIGVVSTDARFFSVFKNNSTVGRIVLAPPQEYPTKALFRDFAFSDVDGNGSLDVVLGNTQATSFSTFKNTSQPGAISFANRIDYSTVSSISNIALGDLSGDGIPDLIVQNNNINYFSIFRNHQLNPANCIITLSASTTNPDCNQGNGSISIKPTSGTAPYQYSINGGANYIAGPDTGYIFENIAPGEYMIKIKDAFGAVSAVHRKTIFNVCSYPVPTITSFAPLSGPVSTIVAINGTNFSSIPSENIVYFGAVRAIVTTATANLLNVIVPIGATYQPISVMVNGLSSYSAEKFIITFDNQNTSVANAFAQPELFTSILRPGNVTSVSDFDGDGNADIAVTRGSAIAVFSNLSNVGNITLAQPLMFPGISITDQQSGDLDGDGKPDLIIVSPSKLSVYRNTSIPGAINFTLDYQIALPAPALSVSLGDFNSNGKPDIVVSNFNFKSPGFTIYENQSEPGIITLMSGVFYALPGILPYSIAVGDIDADNKPDIVIGSTYMNNTGSKLSLFKNTTIGESISFANESVYNFSLQDPRMLSISDLDGDKKLDIIASAKNGSIFWRNYSNNSNLNFRIEEQIPTMSSLFGLGDLNGDGKVDVVSGNEVWINSSTAISLQFKLKEQFTNFSIYNNSVADIDGDGKPDIIAMGILNNQSIDNGVMYIFRYQANSNCIPPTFLNNNSIVLNASCLRKDGNISIIPTSGVAPFMYSIDGGATYFDRPDAGYTFTGLAPGNYQLRLKDARGCESEIIHKTITELYGKPVFNSFPYSVSNANCNQNDGSITVFADHSNQANFGLPLMYSIDGGATYVQHNATAYTFNNLAAGNYQVRLKSMVGCVSGILEANVQNINCPSLTQTSIGLNKGMITGENSTVEKLKVSVYPNPGKGRFTLQLLQPGTGKGELSIFDAKGTLVQKSNINMSKGGLFNVNLEGKAPGLYYFKLVSPMGTSTAKVVKQ